MVKRIWRSIVVVLGLMAVLILPLLAMSACGAKPGTAAAGGAAAKKGGPAIRWRLQTYSGAALTPFVCGDAIKDFNVAANGEMVIDLYVADELVPQGELFQALQRGTIDAAVSDDDSMASPIDVAVFGAYFPLAARYGIDVDVLWNWYGLNEIWKEAYDEFPGVTWLSQGSWDPCNFATTKPIRRLSDLKGLRIYMFPTGGQFMTKFGVVPVSMPYADVQMAIQTGMLDGVCWSGITEDYTVGWADVCKYYLTNPISGGWSGGWFVNTKSWEKVPEHLKKLFMITIQRSHYQRLHWYWWGEAHYRTKGGKMELTTIPASEWAQVEKAALEFWDETAKKSPRAARVVQIIKDYNATMVKAGPPYRY